MISEFCCDGKYDNVIAELTRRGWTHLSDTVVVPPSCQLIWRNLSKIDWGSVFGRYVNHIRGAHHMSNKVCVICDTCTIRNNYVQSYLAYHLTGSDRSHVLPPSWSPAFQDLAALISMVSLNSLLVMATSICDGMDHPDLSRFLNTHSRVHRELLSVGSPTWQSSKENAMHSKLLVHLIDYNDGGVDLAACETVLRAAALELPVWTSCRGREFQLDRGMWIVKPVAQSCGRDISVVRGLDALLQTLHAMEFNCVVQKYIERPLLIRAGRKFDIRQWVLVTCVNPLILYGFSECYLRLCGNAFSVSDENLADSNIHLCNHSVNKAFEGAADDEETSWTSFTMMTQQEFAEALERGACAGLDAPLHTCELGGENVFRRRILPQIRSVCIAAVEACRDRFSPVGRAFEWLGIDLMVTEVGEVLLLEVNISPDTSASTMITSRLVKAATRDLFDLVLEGAVDSPTASLVCAEQSYRTGSARWDVGMGVSGDSAADFVRRFEYGSEASADVLLPRPGDHLSDLSDALLWQLWHVGHHETQRELEHLRAEKTNKFGALRFSQPSHATSSGPYRGREIKANQQLVTIISNIISSNGILSTTGCSSDEEI